MEQLQNILKKEVIPNTGINFLHTAIIGLLAYVLFKDKL